MMTGAIRDLDPRGFGFIASDDGTPRFFAAQELRGGATFERLTIGQRVTFKPARHPRRGPKALNIYLEQAVAA